MPEIVFYLVLIITFAVLLIKDYSMDWGYHRKAKWLHGILMFFLIGVFADSFLELLKIIFEFNSFNKSIVRVGIYARELQLGFQILYQILGVVILFCLVNMMFRNGKARKTFTYLFPLICLLSFVQSYISLLRFEEAIGQFLWNSLITNIVIMTALCLGTVKLYQSDFVLKFFARETENIEDLIDRIGGE
ncbi:MAG: hypothetical protein AAF696_05085 [Bacteroidota bacterium]